MTSRRQNAHSDRRRGRSPRRRSASRETPPRAPVERGRQDRLDQPAGDDVRPSRSSAGRSPRRSRRASARPAGRGTSSSGRTRTRSGPTRRAPGCRPKRAGRSAARAAAKTRRWRAIASSEERGRAPEERRRRAGRPGRRRRLGNISVGVLRCRRSASRRPAGAVGRRVRAWSNGPASVSSAWSRTGTIASSDSSAPFGLPGRLTIRLPPRTPATPRLRSAIGVERRPSARIASASPGTS